MSVDELGIRSLNLIGEHSSFQYKLFDMLTETARLTSLRLRETSGQLVDVLSCVRIHS